MQPFGYEDPNYLARNMAQTSNLSQNQITKEKQIIQLLRSYPEASLT